MGLDRPERNTGVTLNFSVSHLLVIAQHDTQADIIGQCSERMVEVHRDAGVSLHTESVSTSSSAPRSASFLR